MKKYLYGALALPLLFACSSEEFEKEVVSNDQFAGIEKVDATFSFDEGVTRMDDGTGWTLANGDKYGFAWLGDGTVIDPSVNGNAYQNHPLTQTNGIFKPETSIYVGKYYIYRPYDYETVDIGEINFNSLANQTLTEGQTGEPWKKLAETSIIIGDKWTDIVAGGRTYGTDPTIWDEPGIEKRYKVFAAFFSNQSGLDVKYKKNNEKFDGKSIAGATDISYTYPAGSTIGAADITKVEATLAGQANSFTYAPTAEPNTGDHDGDFWASQKNLNTTITGAGFTWNAGAITLNAPDADGVSTGANGSTAWFWFNSLPNTAGTATLNDNVTAKFYTSYGDVTVNEQLKNCAYVYDKYDGTSPWEWIKLVTTADNPSSSPKEWNFGSHNTFVTVIPSVQVGAGVPLQSTTMPQTAVQSTMAPVQSGSVLGVAPGTIVPVRLGNSIVHVPTQPVQTQTLHMSMQPQPQYQTVSVPAEPEVPMGLPENVVPAPQYGQATTPTLKTLKPRIIRKELPPQYKTRQLPAKVVTQRLPPIGPPATPQQVNYQAPIEPPQQVQTVVVPQPTPVQTIMVPTVSVPQYQTVSVPVSTIQTAPIAQPSVANYGTTSVLATY